ncbi:MAG: Tol-Pal system protein TolB, partial [Betaproteobacteria bacterium]|nr:Tol-Pal system protein TolB [Betaproteobacteria bacterium]
MPQPIRFFLTLVAIFLFFSGAARAQLTIEIVGGAGSAIPIAIVPFEGESAFPLGITGIVGADLSRSGLFKLVDYTGVVPRPVRAEDVQSEFWRGRGADAVVVGTMRPLPDGRTEVRFALVDVVKQVPLTSMIYTVTPAQFRATAHKIADA